jgi:arabinan endo-1,5-alpha-L-arabinosidase
MSDREPLRIRFIRFIRFPPLIMLLSPVRSFSPRRCGLFGALLLGLLLPAGAAAKQVSIHDPVMAREGDTYYLFSTGPGITFYSSTDRQTWRLRGRIFPGEPAWAKEVSPSFNGHVWAPDILFHGGRYYLYYSVSAFGRNTSAMGVTVNRTLDPDSPDYRWEDQGIVLRSVPNRDLWNAIDPHVIIDQRGTPWMSFGSFWGGLKLVRLAPDLLSVAEPQEWYSIAKRERSVLLDDTLAGPAEIEAPFIFYREGYYYLFVSWDKCCRGAESTYRMMVGRSPSVTGPYLDREDRDLAAGGGTLLLAGTPAWAGVGHNSVYTFDGRDYLVFHAYETADRGLQKLKIAELGWDAEGWPTVDARVLDEYVSQLLPEAS